VPGLRYEPEKGAQLKVLRWKRFVQGDEDAWLANTRKFTDKTGVDVLVESVNSEDLRPKGAMSASVGAGPDIMMGPPDMPQLYPDKCVDLSDLAEYLGQKYGGWCDVRIAGDIQHAHLPIGPVGRPTELRGFFAVFVFKHTKYPNAAREYLRFMMEREQYEVWTQASLGFMGQTLRAYESNPVWTSDPKVTPFRDGARLTLYRGYPGKVGHASAACAADFVVENMMAGAASGQSSPRAAITRAEQRAKRYYKS
jgi:ABC-type glycerol-3-phosphate transport system substrate-binding protein